MSGRKTQSSNRTVLGAIQERLSAQSPTESRLGLAVDGGGLRGVVTAAMLIALRDLGILECFDAYYATSSGAFNLIRVLRGADWPDLLRDYEQLAAQLFKITARAGKMALLDMEFVKELNKELLGLNASHPARSESRLHILLTDLKSKTIASITPEQAGDDLLQFLVAGAWLPYLAGSPPVIRNTAYCDGFILVPQSAAVALDDGCSHVLSLSPVQYTWLGGVRASARRAVTAIALDAWLQGLGRAYLASRRSAVTRMGGDAYRRDTQTDQGTWVRLAPSPQLIKVGYLSSSPTALVHAAAAGYQEAFSYLAPVAVPVSHHKSTSAG